jgi:hypothetical protein
MGNSTRKRPRPTGLNSTSQFSSTSSHRSHQNSSQKSPPESNYADQNFTPPDCSPKKADNDILGVAQNATAKELKTACQSMVRLYHPDKCSKNWHIHHMTVQELTKFFPDILDAYERLRVAAEANEASTEKLLAEQARKTAKEAKEKQRERDEASTSGRNPR